jgi:hypothetical protein
MAALKFAVEFSEYAPTRQAVAVYEALAAKIDAELARFKEAVETDLARLNQQIRESGVPAIAPRPATEAPAS